MTATSSPDPTAGFSYRLPGLLLMSFLLTWIPACSRAGGASGQSLGELLNLASKANIQHDIEAEEGYLRKALEAVGPNREKTQARRELARTRWKFHRDFDEASRLLSEAADIPAEPAKTWVERAEMELARPNHQAAREAAERAVELVETSFESRAAVVALGKVTVAENVLRRLNHQSIDRESLSKVQQSVQNMVAEAVGDLEASELALTASILLGRGSDAWLAWRSYYHVIQLEFAPSLLAKPAIRLEKILLNWKRGNSSPEDRRALIHALADTRFFQEAALVALDPAGIESDSLLQEARVREIVGYAEFCREIETISDEFYRKTAIGKGERQAYTISIKKAVSELWLHLNDPGPAPPIFGSLSQIRPTLDRELGPRFGSHIRPGNSSGYYGMHFGHEIARDKKTARQYGHSASVTYTVLDRMVSNGF